MGRVSRGSAFMPYRPLTGSLGSIASAPEKLAIRAGTASGAEDV